MRGCGIYESISNPGFQPLPVKQGNALRLSIDPRLYFGVSTMRTITLLLTILISQMPAAYIPSTVYVQRKTSKIIVVEQEKNNARNNNTHGAVLEIPNIGESQTLSTTGAAMETSTDLYDVAPVGKPATSAAPMRNCCIQGK